MALSDSIKALATRAGTECGSLAARVTAVEKNTGGGASVLMSASGTRSAAIAAGAAFTVPSYIVGSGRLQVWLDGVLCAGGVDADVCAYAETGTAGAASTTITFYQSISIDVEIIARVQ